MQMMQGIFGSLLQNIFKPPVPDPYEEQLKKQQEEQKKKEEERKKQEANSRWKKLQAEEAEKKVRELEQKQKEGQNFLSRMGTGSGAQLSSFKWEKGAESELQFKPTGTSESSMEQDLDVKLEQAEFDDMNADWIIKQRQLIEQRFKESNQYISAIYKSLKIKSPPPLPNRKYDELQPGDVLLISPEDKGLWDKISDSSFWINAGDRISSASLSPASHTILYLREVNGKKLFLDHTLEGGSHVISEEEFLKTYGQRDALVASRKISVAQPVKEAEAARIWEATRELVKNEAKIQAEKSEKIISNLTSQTGYGLIGNDYMVCSEASRWVLVKSGRDIPETASPLKRLLGIHYGPANFFSDEYNFVVTPLWDNIEK